MSRYVVPVQCSVQRKRSDDHVAHQDRVYTAKVWDLGDLHALIMEVVGTSLQTCYSGLGRISKAQEFSYKMLKSVACKLVMNSVI